MEKRANLPSRKLPRLRCYDYQSNSFYFLPICADKRKLLFSSIFKDSSGMVHNQLSRYGEIIEHQLLLLPQRYPSVLIDKYVIMPNHLHIILATQSASGSSEYSLSDIICAFKSLATRECKKVSPIERIFQKSFYDHIIRNSDDYETIWSYIDSNPEKWLEDTFYSEK